MKQKADNTPKTVAGSGYPVKDASIAPSSSVAPDKTNILVIGGPSGVGKGTVLKLLYAILHHCYNILKTFLSDSMIKFY